MGASNCIFLRNLGYNLRPFLQTKENIFSVQNRRHWAGGRLNAKVLVLNQSYEPMSVISVRKAIVLLYLGKAELLEAYDGKQLRSVSMAMPFPSVLRLGFYVKVPDKSIILSRKNILRRDGHRCQFCGRGDLGLTLDHVIPVSRGGEDTWENLVCACVDCNNGKGDRTPEEASMPLRRKPMRPNHVTFIRQFVGTVNERWKPYLFLH